VRLHATNPFLSSTWYMGELKEIGEEHFVTNFGVKSIINIKKPWFFNPKIGNNYESLTLVESNNWKNKMNAWFSTQLKQIIDNIHIHIKSQNVKDTVSEIIHRIIENNEVDELPHLIDTLTELKLNTTDWKLIISRLKMYSKEREYLTAILNRHLPHFLKDKYTFDHKFSKFVEQIQEDKITGEKYNILVPHLYFGHVVLFPWLKLNLPHKDVYYGLPVTLANVKSETSMLPNVNIPNIKNFLPSKTDQKDDKITSNHTNESQTLSDMFSNMNKNQARNQMDAERERLNEMRRQLEQKRMEDRRDDMQRQFERDDINIPSRSNPFDFNRNTRQSDADLSPFRKMTTTLDSDNDSDFNFGTIGSERKFNFENSLDQDVNDDIMETENENNLENNMDSEENENWDNELLSDDPDDGNDIDDLPRLEDEESVTDSDDNVNDNNDDNDWDNELLSDHEDDELEVGELDFGIDEEETKMERPEDVIDLRDDDKDLDEPLEESNEELNMEQKADTRETENEGVGETENEGETEKQVKTRNVQEIEKNVSSSDIIHRHYHYNCGNLHAPQETVIPLEQQQQQQQQQHQQQQQQQVNNNTCTHQKYKVDDNTVFGSFITWLCEEPENCQQ